MTENGFVNSVSITTHIHTDIIKGDKAAKAASGFSTIRQLVISGPGLSEEGIEAISCLENLETLVISANGLRPSLSDESLHYLRKLTRLKLLSIASSSATDAGLEILSELPNLEELRLDCPNLTGVGLKHAMKLPHIIKLYVIGE